MDRPPYAMSPPWNVVWPMIVASSVVLPTPLRPSTASEPRAPSETSTSSSTTVAPYPARTPASVRPSAMALAEVHAMHARVVADLVGRPLAEHLPLHQDRDAAGEAEDEVHVVLDDEDGDLARQPLERVQDLSRLERRHA